MSRSRTRNHHVAAKAITHRRARLHVKRIIAKERDTDASLAEFRNTENMINRVFLYGVEDLQL